MKRLLTVLSVPILALNVSSTVSAQGNWSLNRFDGTWGLDFAKTKGPNISTSEMQSYKSRGDDLNLLR